MGSRHSVGISGAGGFIGGSLFGALRAQASYLPLVLSREDLHSPNLDERLRNCDTVVHLAGMIRGDEAELYRVNMVLAERLVESLSCREVPPDIVFVSSTQRDEATGYGRAKRDGEKLLRQWAERSGASLTVLVVPNVFGPGGRPFHNSVVATFCHLLARKQAPELYVDRELELVEVHEVVAAIIDAIEHAPDGVDVRRVPGTGTLSTSALLALLTRFAAEYFDRNRVPDLGDPLHAALYRTFLSYLEPADHRHLPQQWADHRGALFEVIRLANAGQVFFSTTKPGVVRGDHYHRRKVEWFCVVRGRAVVRMRRVGERFVHEFPVSGQSPEFISIPPMFTHHIENCGDEELLTMFWSSTEYEPGDPDTWVDPVLPNDSGS